MPGLWHGTRAAKRKLIGLPRGVAMHRSALPPTARPYNNAALPAPFAYLT